MIVRDRSGVVVGVRDAGLLSTKGVPLFPALIGRLLMTLASPMRYFRPSRMHETGGRIYGGGFGDRPELVERYARTAPAPQPLGYYAQMLAGVGWTSACYLPRLRQQVLLIAGDDDPIIPLVNARLMSALPRHATVHVVPGSGHLALLTRLDELIPLLAGFLADPERAAAT